MTVRYPERIALANLPTEIEKLEKLSAELGGPQVYIKRDDLTESVASGNKIRKLEFVVADALEKGADTLVTCGWSHSNHARATAVIAAKLGLNAVLLLRGEEPGQYRGNLLLDKLVGAEIRFLTLEEYERRDEIMEQVAEELKKKEHIAYLIPSGATDEIGVWGYIKAAQEIKEQLEERALEIDAVVTAVGTGGTLAGLLLGKELFELDTAIYGINVDEDAEYFRDRIYELTERWQRRYDVNIGLSKGDIELIDGYAGVGYGLSQREEQQVIRWVARKEGIILDPVYTGKAMHGLIEEIEKGRFKRGQNILFIHTGGIFGLLGASEEFEL